MIFPIVVSVVIATIGNHATITAASVSWQEKENFRFALNCDFPYNDIRSESISDADKCRSRCGQLNECTHFAWNWGEDGTCWLKKGGIKEENVVAIDDENLLCGYKSGSSAKYTAGQKAGQPNEWRQVENFRISDDCDFPYNDIGSETISNVEQCRTRCGQLPNCTHFTWVKNGDTTLCWLKYGHISEKDAIRFNFVCGYKTTKSGGGGGGGGGSNTTNEGHCGNRPASFRIVNGREAAPNSWPWMVSILDVDGEESKHICGGTLIAPSKILTAAHCFKFKTESSVYKIRLGSHKLSEKGAHEVERQVTSVVLHEKYVKLPASPYDIAILTLDSAVEFNDFVSPLCLGKPLQLLPGVSCYVIGWGKTKENGDFSDVLLELELPILPRGECKKILADKFDPDLQICGAYENGGKDACQGDSGGPLVCEDKKADKWRLQGIVSWGKGCAVKGNPGVYTRVSYYKDWIMQHISSGRLKF